MIRSSQQQFLLSELKCCLWDQVYDSGEVKSNKTMLEAFTLAFFVQDKMHCTVYKSHCTMEQYTAYVGIPVFLI